MHQGKPPKCSIHLGSRCSRLCCTKTKRTVADGSAVRVNIPSHCDLICEFVRVSGPGRRPSTCPEFSLFPLVSAGDGRLFHASCRKGARLFVSPGASLATHPLCRDSVHRAHAFMLAWTPHAAPCQCPQGPSGLVRVKAPNLQPIFPKNFLSVDFFFFRQTILPFLTVFQ